MGLVKPDGFVGLLTPSGIYADKTAADFFKSLSTSGRVSGLFDFENKKVFFKDVHASFKFCALILGGEERRFQETECAFFLHDTETISDPNRCFALAPSDFARVNPNTGTAPIFRTRRDTEITRRIYERHPVLVDRSLGEERKAWPVRYATMFHMTNDSHLFRTATQLDSEGFYPVQGNRWKRGDDLYLPLYEGKMVQALDHRAASGSLSTCRVRASCGWPRRWRCPATARRPFRRGRAAGAAALAVPHPAADGPDLVVVGALPSADTVALSASSLEVDGDVHVAA